MIPVVFNLFKPHPTFALTCKCFLYTFAARLPKLPKLSFSPGEALAKSP